MSGRDFAGGKKGYEWGDDADARPPKNAKKGVTSSASSSAGSAALSEVSCDALSIMEWATDLLSPSENNNEQDDVFAETPKVSPLRHRRIPTPSKIRSKRQGNYPPEQRLPKNDLPGPQMKAGAPDWEGTTITADAKNTDEVSVMTPFGGDTQRDQPKTTQKYNIPKSPRKLFGWDKFEVSRWDAGFPEESSTFSENEEGMNAMYKKQPLLLPRNKKKLFWIGSIAVLLIVIIAIAVPLSKNSNNAAATNGNENISTELENNTTVPVISESSPSQSAASPESDTVDESFVNGQATTVPEGSNPATPQPKPSLANEPISSPVSTVVESNPAASENNEPISSPASVGEPIPSPTSVSNQINEAISPPVSTAVEPKPTPLSQPATAQNNEPVTSPVSTAVEQKPSPSQPATDQNNGPVTSPVSTAVEQKPSPSQPATAQNNGPVTSPVSTALEPNPTPLSQPATAQNNGPVTSPVSTAVEQKPSPSQSATAQNNGPVTSPVSTAVEPNPTPSQPATAQNNEPVTSPVSTAVEPNPTPSQQAVSQNNESSSLPASSVVEYSVAEQPVPSAQNNEPVTSNNQQDTGSNAVGEQSPANSQPVTVPQPTPNPTKLPTLPPTPSCINVQIKTDKFGHETSWVLRDVDRNRELASVPEDTYGANEETLQEFCGLESGKYKFIIRDKYGDGLCCGNGRGKFRVSLNGQQMFWGGYFKKELSFDILVGYDPHGTLTDREYEYWVSLPFWFSA